MVTPELLRGFSQLAELPDDILNKLASIATEKTASVNDTLFGDMDPATAMYLVVKGEVRLCCEIGTGELRTMETVTDGELFAWSSLVEPYRYTSTAVASAQTDLVLFDAATLRTMCADDQDLGYEVLTRIVQLLAGRLGSVRGRLANEICES